jgi:hypothetical protein
MKGWQLVAFGVFALLVNLGVFVLCIFVVLKMLQWFNVI